MGVKFYEILGEERVEVEEALYDKDTNLYKLTGLSKQAGGIKLLMVELRENRVIEYWRDDGSGFCDNKRSFYTLAEHYDYILTSDGALHEKNSELTSEESELLRWIEHPGNPYHGKWDLFQRILKTKYNSVEPISPLDPRISYENYDREKHLDYKPWARVRSWDTNEGQLPQDVSRLIIQGRLLWITQPSPRPDGLGIDMGSLNFDSYGDRKYTNNPVDELFGEN